jgi:putative Se/S carrier protein
MKEKEYTLITFKSTHHSIAAEEVFEEKDMDFKTIPTPREVSHSCGLALLFSIEDIEKVKEIIEKEKIKIDGLYEFTKNISKNTAKRII